MNFNHSILKSIFIIQFMIGFLSLNAQEPIGYYKNADGKKNAILKTSLHNIIRNHIQLEYYSSSTYFLTTDWHPDGYIWDMYSNNKRSSWYGMNREHSMPKSWWSANPELTVAYSDLHNLYPSDAEANSAKLNYPLGEVDGNGEYANGVIKVGINGFGSYKSIVFEPADEFKGDFARDYMYMVTCYEDYAQSWRSLGTGSMLTLGTYPVFNAWAVSLILKWHRNDSVSPKEIRRNNAIYGFQKNRNPFIDHPELAEFIWGKYKDETWNMDGTLPQSDVPIEVYFDQSSLLLTVKLSKPATSFYAIHSLSGVQLKTGNFDLNGTIEVDELQNGMYIIVIYSGTIRKVSKFILHRS